MIDTSLTTTLRKQSLSLKGNEVERASNRNNSLRLSCILQGRESSRNNCSFDKTISRNALSWKTFFIACCRSLCQHHYTRNAKLYLDSLWIDKSVGVFGFEGLLPVFLKSQQVHNRQFSILAQ
jgi:hypothetical protein